MGVTLPVLRSQLRDLLLDAVGPQVWSDSALTHCLYEAIAEHSFQFPAQVTAKFSLSAGQTEVPLYALPSQLPQALPLDPTGAATQAAQILGVLRVELPVGTVLPDDGGQATDPAASGSAIYRQAYRWRAGWIYLRNAAGGPEVGADTMRVELLQTWSVPSEDGTITWDGPAHDLPLLLLLAKRTAYQLLAEWRARDDNASLGIDPTLVLPAVDVAIGQALAVRFKRAVRSRTLDI